MTAVAAGVVADGPDLVWAPDWAMAALILASAACWSARSGSADLAALSWVGCAASAGCEFSRLALVVAEAGVVLVRLAEVVALASVAELALVDAARWPALGWARFSGAVGFEVVGLELLGAL